MVRGMGEDGEQYVGGVRASLDGLFFLPYYSILVFSKLLTIILIILPNIIFILPIIPSLNTIIHHAPNRFLLYR